MVLAQIPTISAQTFLKVFIVHGLIFGSCLFFTYMILKRDRKPINFIISGFYILVAAGFFVNFTYVLLSFEPNQDLVRNLYHLTMILELQGTFCLTIFSLVLLKTENIFTQSKQLLAFIIALCFNLGLIFVPLGLSIGPETNWNPVYGIGYYLYIFITFSVISVIPQVYCFFKIYARIEQEFLLRRWKSFILGTLLFYIMCYGTITYHLLDIQIIRTIWSYISLGLVISSMILIYYGVIKME